MSAAWHIASTVTDSTPCVANSCAAAATMRSCTSRTRRSRREADAGVAPVARFAMRPLTAHLTVTVNYTNGDAAAVAHLRQRGHENDEVRIALRDRSRTPLD